MFTSRDLLIIFTNSFGPDQNRENVGSDLDPNCLYFMVLLKEFFEIKYFEQSRNLLDFCSGIQFYLLLTPYLCFISLLYLELYVLGDDALIS